MSTPQLPPTAQLVLPGQIGPVVDLSTEEPIGAELEAFDDQPAPRPTAPPTPTGPAPANQKTETLETIVAPGPRRVGQPVAVTPAAPKPRTEPQLETIAAPQLRQRPAREAISRPRALPTVAIAGAGAAAADLVVNTAAQAALLVAPKPKPARRAKPSSGAALAQPVTPPTPEQSQVEQSTPPAPTTPQVPAPIRTAPASTQEPWLPEATRQGIKVNLLLPWYKSSNPLTATSVAALLKRRDTAWSIDFGDAFIAHSRNKLAAKFLAKGNDWCLFIDDDMIIPFGDEAWINNACGFIRKIPGTNIIDKLLADGKTLVGGLYRGRYAAGDWMFGEARSSKKLGREIFDGIHHGVRITDWVGTGCMLVHRKVFLDIEAKYPHLARKSDGTGGNWFSSSEHDLVKGVDDALAILEDTTASDGARMIEAQRLLIRARQASESNSKLGTGEDVIFCHRARQSGHQPHVDLDAICGHMGFNIFGFDRTYSPNK